MVRVKRRTAENASPLAFLAKHALKGACGEGMLALDLPLFASCAARP